jgi:hypothetical protein
MAGVVAPNVELAGNLLSVENMGHLLVHLTADIVNACGEDAGIAAIVMKIVSFVHVRHVVRRQVEVAILIVVTGEKAGWTERAAHRENRGEDLRVTKAKVNRMVTPETTSNGDETGVAVKTADERNDLIEKVLFKPEMAREPGTRDDGAVIPTFSVDRIDTEELQAAGFEFVLNGGHHVTMLQFSKSKKRPQEVEKARAGGPACSKTSNSISRPRAGDNHL